MWPVQGLWTVVALALLSVVISALRGGAFSLMCSLILSAAAIFLARYDYFVFLSMISLVASFAFAFGRRLSSTDPRTIWSKRTLLVSPLAFAVAYVGWLNVKYHWQPPQIFGSIANNAADAANQQLTDIVIARFPKGTDEANVIDELRKQDFKRTRVDMQLQCVVQSNTSHIMKFATCPVGTKEMTYEWLSSMCGNKASVRWLTDAAGKIASIEASSWGVCP